MTVGGKAIGTALALALLAPAAWGAAPLPIAADGRMVHWDTQRNADPQRYRGAGLTLALSRQTTGSESARAHLKVYQGGRLAIELAGADGFSIAPTNFALARLDPAASGPGVVFTTNVGGAHCCTRIAVAEPLGGRWRAVTVGEFDTDAPDRIVDVDGDGWADIVVIDDRFDYAFASFAGSFRPPRVYDIVDGRSRDVSAEPRFRPLFEKDFAEAAQACLHPEPKAEINGACAAYVADAARLGRFDDAWSAMLAHYDKAMQSWPGGCSVAETRGACPKGRGVDYQDYPTALKSFLIRTGYLR
jgi:hypothetical protein